MDSWLCIEVGFNSKWNSNRSWVRTKSDFEPSHPDLGSSSGAALTNI